MLEGRILNIEDEQMVGIEVTTNKPSKVSSHEQAKARH